MNNMKIEILGTGCQNCRKLYDNVQQVVRELGLNAEVVKVEDIKEIMKYGVMSMPALAVDGVVKTAGKVPGKDELKKLLQ